MNFTYLHVYKILITFRYKETLLTFFLLALEPRVWSHRRDFDVFKSKE